MPVGLDEATRLLEDVLEKVVCELLFLLLLGQPGQLPPVVDNWGWANDLYLPSPLIRIFFPPPLAPSAFFAFLLLFPTFSRLPPPSVVVATLLGFRLPTSYLPREWRVSRSQWGPPPESVEEQGWVKRTFVDALLDGLADVGVLTVLKRTEDVLLDVL